MMVLHVPRPWAWRIVLGRSEVLNLPRKVKLDRHVAINAMRRWDARAGEMVMDEPTGLIGLVRFSRIVPGEECQLRGVWGRFVAVYDGSTVLDHPYPFRDASPYSVTHAPDDLDLGSFLLPREYLQRRADEARHGALLRESSGSGWLD